MFTCVNKSGGICLRGQGGTIYPDTMTGCSIGALSGSTPKVAHLNYTLGGNPESAIDQVKIGGEMTKVFGRAPDVQLNKADYINAKGQNGNVTVVGVRKNNNWHFFINGAMQLGRTIPAELTKLSAFIL